MHELNEQHIHLNVYKILLRYFARTGILTNKEVLTTVTDNGANIVKANTSLEETSIFRVSHTH